MKRFLIAALYAASLSASPVGSILSVRGSTSTAVLELNDGLQWQTRTTVPRLFAAMSATGELVVGNPAGTSLTEIWKYTLGGTPTLVRALTDAYESYAPYSPTEVLAYSRARGLKLISAQGEKAFCSSASLRRPRGDATMGHRGGTEILRTGSTQPVQPGTQSSDYIFERIWQSASNSCALAYMEPLPYHATGIRPALAGDDALHVMQGPVDQRVNFVNLQKKKITGNNVLATFVSLTTVFEPMAIGDRHPSLPAVHTDPVAYYRRNDDLLALSNDGSDPVVLAAGIFDEALLRAVTGLPAGALKLVQLSPPTKLAGFGGLPASAPAKAAPAPSVAARFQELWDNGYRAGLVPTKEVPCPLYATSLVQVIEGQPMASEWVHMALRELPASDHETLGIEWRGVNWRSTGTEKTLSLKKLVELVTATKSCQVLLSQGS